MGRVSTTNYRESLETGKEFLPKTFFIRMNQFTKSKINKCKDCGIVLWLTKGNEQRSLCFECQSKPYIKPYIK